jgi:hypothetical protein
VRFACEIAAIVAFVWWGWPVVGIIAGAIVIVVWGAFVAPKATRRLPDPIRLLIEIGIFALATLAFVAVDQRTFAVIFAAAAAVTALLSRRLNSP